MKAVVAAFNQEKALVGTFSVLTNLRMELFQALIMTGWNVTVSPACRAAEAEAVASFVQLVTLCLGGDTDTLTIYLHNIYHPHVSVSQSSLH